MNTPIRVLMPIYTNMNTLDLNGPVEVLRNFALPTDSFQITLAAAQSGPVKTFETVTVNADIDFATAQAQIQNFDVLIMPGGITTAIQILISTPAGDSLFDLLKAFLKTLVTDSPRWLISICTGALLVDHVCGFAGMEATTHWAALGDLINVPVDKRVRVRWVDGGLNENGIRVVSSGGISCGLDCVLWFLSEALGLQQAVNVAATMDYVWNYPHANLVPNMSFAVPSPTAWTTTQF